MNCLRPMIKKYRRDEEKKNEANHTIEAQMKERESTAINAVNQPAVQSSSKDANKSITAYPAHEILDGPTEEPNNPQLLKDTHPNGYQPTTKPALPLLTINDEINSIDSFIQSKENGALSGSDIIIPTHSVMKNNENESPRIHHVLIQTFSKLFLETKKDVLTMRDNHNVYFNEKLQGEELSSNDSFSNTTHESASC